MRRTIGAMLFGFGFVMVAKYYPLSPIFEENAWLAVLLIAMGTVVLFVEDFL